MTWDEHAKNWDEREAVRAYADAAFGCLTALCEKRGIALQGARTFDFGCGTGLLAEKLAPLCAEIVALDTSVRMIESLRAKIQRLPLSNVHPTESSLQGALTSNPRMSQPFDLVTCSSVCAFVEDYTGTVFTLTRLLRPGGMFVQWDWEFDATNKEPFGLTREQVKTALSSAGLKSIQVETAFEISAEGDTMRPLVGVGQTAK